MEHVKWDWVKVAARAPIQHKVASAGVLAVLYFVLEYHFQAHTASKVVEMFGVIPFADRCVEVAERIVGE